MIDLDIDGEYGLQSDKRQFILGRHSTRERKGEEVHMLKDRTFHKTLESALGKYAERRMKDGEEIADFGGMIKVQTETNKILKSIESELKKANEQFLEEKQE